MNTMKLLSFVFDTRNIYVDIAFVYRVFTHGSARRNTLSTTI